MYDHLNQIKFNVQMNMKLDLNSLLFKDSKVFTYSFENDTKER